MTHRAIKLRCEVLGLQVTRVSAGGTWRYEASKDGLGVKPYWTTTYADELVGIPRIAFDDGGSIAFRNLNELEHAITSEQ